tara:strand:- start:255 stop:443 length:189 start_codon:yes stop_codon:yes gene_type:complete
MKVTRKDAIKVSAGANTSLVFSLEASLSQEVLIEKKILSTRETIPVIGIEARSYRDRTIQPA